MISKTTSYALGPLVLFSSSSSSSSSPPPPSSCVNVDNKGNVLVYIFHSERFPLEVR